MNAKTMNHSFTYPYYKGARTVQGTDKCEIEFVKANSYLTFVTAILAFYIPVIIMIYLYWRIWLETKKRYRDLTTLFLVSGVGAAAPARSTRPMLHAGKQQQVNSTTPPFNRQPSVKRLSSAGCPATTVSKQVANATVKSLQYHSDQQRRPAPSDSAPSGTASRHTSLVAPEHQPETTRAQTNPTNEAALQTANQLPGHSEITVTAEVVGGQPLKENQSSGTACNNDNDEQQGAKATREGGLVQQVNKCKCPCCPRLLCSSCKKSKKYANPNHCTKGSNCRYRVTSSPDNCPRCLSELQASELAADGSPTPEVGAPVNSKGSSSRSNRHSPHQHHNRDHHHRNHHHHHHHHHQHNHSHCNKAYHHHNSQQSRHCDRSELLSTTKHHSKSKSKSKSSSGKQQQQQQIIGCSCSLKRASNKIRAAHYQDETLIDYPTGDKSAVSGNKLSLLSSGYHQLLSTSSSSLMRKVHPTAPSQPTSITPDRSSGDQQSDDEPEETTPPQSKPEGRADSANPVSLENGTDKLPNCQQVKSTVTTVDIATSPIEFPSTPVIGRSPLASFDGFSEVDEDEDDDDRKHEDDLETRIVAGGDRFRIKSDKLSVSQMLSNFNNGVAVQTIPNPTRNNDNNNPSKRATNCAFCIQSATGNNNSMVSSTGELALCHTRKPVGGHRRCCCDIMFTHDSECRLCNIAAVDYNHDQRLFQSKSARLNCSECRQLGSNKIVPTSAPHRTCKLASCNAGQQPKCSKKISKNCSSSNLDCPAISLNNGGSLLQASNQTATKTSTNDVSKVETSSGALREEARSKTALGKVRLPILSPLSKCSEELPDKRCIESSAHTHSGRAIKLTEASSTTWNPKIDLLRKESSSNSLVSSLNNNSALKNNPKRKSPKKFNQRLTFASGSPTATIKKSSDDSETGLNAHSHNSYSSTRPSSSTYSSHHPIQPKSERKAAKTLSTLLLVFIVTWLPYNVLVLIKTLSGGEDQVPEKIWNFSYYLCYINSTINPLCYALCNAQFRRTYMRILKCKLSNEQHNSTRRLVPLQSSTTWNKDLRIAHPNDGNPATLTSSISHTNNHN